MNIRSATGIGDSRSFSRAWSTHRCPAKVEALVIPNTHPQQRLNIALNGKPIEHLTFNDNVPREVSFVLPSNLLRERNLLEFFLPDAVAPDSLGLGNDSRTLGIAVYWV